ncbi:MAG: PqiC family protein, partial [Gemmatimonadota bacterium]
MDDRTRYRMKATWLVCLATLLGSSGCFGLNRGAPPIQHYVLEGGHSHEVAAQPRDSADLAIALRRPQIASYLDVPFIVVRRGPNQIGLSELHRWGEHLGEGINRAVAGHLFEQGTFRAVDVAPWAPRERHDYLIQLHVLRFEGQLPEEEATLEGGGHVVATWEIIRPEDGRVLTRG